MCLTKMQSLFTKESEHFKNLPPKASRITFRQSSVLSWVTIFLRELLLWFCSAQKIPQASCTMKLTHSKPSSSIAVYKFYSLNVRVLKMQYYYFVSQLTVNLKFCIQIKFQIYTFFLLTETVLSKMLVRICHTIRQHMPEDHYLQPVGSPSTIHMVRTREEIGTRN